LSYRKTSAAIRDSATAAISAWRKCFIVLARTSRPTGQTASAVGNVLAAACE
jgi:hypothetical protein